VASIGVTTTTHWAFRVALRAMGVEVVADRVVWQGNHISGAGVSAGMDMALASPSAYTGAPVAEARQLADRVRRTTALRGGTPVKAEAGTLRLALRLLFGDRPVRERPSFLAKPSVRALTRRPATRV
jgi:cyclohexyl-isocyanide hydratase